ncbi:MAG: 2'-5' RNA ligase family protein [Verrucomicrobiales bacterium]|nr:2'-5' RNA ligase family protein [Verrucomicrobiales bacterium]
MEEEAKGYSIELPLSDESRERLRVKLSEVEGPWQKKKFTPHLSFAVIREPTDNIEALREIVQRFAKDNGPFVIQLSSMGIFPGKRPVFTLMPAWSDKLLKAHHLVADQISAAGILPIPYYRKSQWSPHITIMMGRPRREVGAAMEALSRVWWPGEYELDKIELVEFHPAVKMEQIVLSGPQNR